MFILEPDNMNTSEKRSDVESTSADTSHRVGPHILLIEDDFKFAVQLQNKLRNREDKLHIKGCEVDIATNAEDARTFLRRDEIDIYIVDLEIPAKDGAGPDFSIGRALISEIDAQVCAGIIVFTSSTYKEESTDALEAGADHYVRKADATVPGVAADDYVSRYPATQNESTFKDILARTRALWRRTQLLRAQNRNQFVHTNRIFLLGNWRFVVGTRELTKVGSDEKIKLSVTEHSFLRYVCAIEGHEIDTLHFNLEVLERGEDRRHQ
jgi:DNA-binding response OmpR family regulator